MTVHDTKPLNLASAFNWAWSKYLSRAPRLLMLLVGWAGVWVVVEYLVIQSETGPGRPIWLILHIGYFWGTAYFEAAILRSGLDAVDELARPWRAVFPEHRTVFRFFVVKMILLPSILIGLAFLVLPGLYVWSRWGSSLAIVVEHSSDPGVALGESSRVTGGHRGKLMLLSFVLLCLNAVGAALMGIGLLVSIPVSVLVGAHVFRALSES